MAEEGLVEEKVENTAPEYTPDEEKALANGWTPKGEWDGNPEDWIPAKQFNRNGELFGRINTYKHKIQNLEKSVQDLAKHNQKVYEAGYDDAITSLKAQRRVALREGDPETVEAIEEKIEQVEKKRDEQIQELKETIAPTAAPQHPAFEPWVEKNQWYANDETLRGHADVIAKRIVKENNGQIAFPDLLKEVEVEMREEFSDKLGGRKTTRSSAGSDRGDGQGGARGISKNKVKDSLSEIESNLSDEERSIMKNLISSGVITKEKYLTDMEKVINRKGRGR